MMPLSFATLQQPSQYNRSLFVHVLVILIGLKRGVTDEVTCLNKLYALKDKSTDGNEPKDVIDRITIKRLIESLQTAIYRRTLNRRQMRAIAEYFGLDKEEQQLLYASLIAMQPQSQLLLFGVPAEEAWRVVSIIGDRVMEWLENDDTFMRQIIPSLADGAANEDDIIAALLGPALDAYDEGTAIALGARYIPDATMKLAWYQLALFHFARAAHLLDSLRADATQHDITQHAEWQHWRLVIQQEITALQQRGTNLPEIHAWP